MFGARQITVFRGLVNPVDFATVSVYKFSRRPSPTCLVLTQANSYLYGVVVSPVDFATRKYKFFRRLFGRSRFGARQIIAFRSLVNSVDFATV